MHNYPWSPGDYIAATAHLSETEDLIYRRLLDFLYMTEMPLPKDLGVLARKIRVGKNRLQALKLVLSEFFYETDDGYRQHRADEVLSQIYEKSDKAKQSAEKRWNRNKCERIANAVPTQSDGNANGMLPINLLPINPLTQNISLSKDNSSADKQPTIDRHRLDRFEDVWSAYQRPDGKGSKKKAIEEWKKLTLEQKKDAWAMVDEYLKVTWQEGGKFRPHVERYLKNRLWEGLDTNNGRKE